MSIDPAMSVDPTDDSLRALEEQINEALIAFCRLSPEAVAQIRESMMLDKLTFPDAAAKLGLVSSREIAETLVWVRDQTGTHSVVETAIKRQAATRNLTERRTGQVKPGPSLILAHDPDNPRSERLRALRTELLLLTEPINQGCVMALVSPCAGEGRSQLCAELGIAFAQLGRKTLLIDADLRHPGQHELFGAPNQWGLAQALSFGEPPQLLGVEGQPYLTLLCTGPPVANPLELISDGRFERLLAEWRRRYDFVIIDTPPITQFADALAIATLAGRVLVISRAQVTAQRDMKEMLRRLGSTRSRVIGAVINQF
jgi:receptor protein-tyrosine kinase